MSEQIPLDLAWRQSADAGDFIVAAPNVEAVAWIDKWPDWPAVGLLLLGNKAVGKTHLANVWKVRAEAQYVTTAEALNQINGNAVLDNIDQWAKREQAALFHILNCAKENKFSLLLCATLPTDGWEVTLPDLLSRLKVLPIAKLGEPDDALLAALFTRALNSRGMVIKPDVLDYLFPRLPRDAAAIANFAQRLDAYALQSRKGLTLAIARAFMQTVI